MTTGAYDYGVFGYFLISDSLIILTCDPYVKANQILYVRSDGW